jgi:hypothetical protein
MAATAADCVILAPGARQDNSLPVEFDTGHLPVLQQRAGRPNLMIRHFFSSLIV